MAGELGSAFTNGDWMREQSEGYNPWAFTALTGSVRALRLNKLDVSGYTVVNRLPAAVSLATGLSFTFGLVDSGEYASDPGKVVTIGITLKRLAQGNTLSMDSGTGLAAEVLTNITLQATAGTLTITTVGILAANLPASLVAGDRIGIRMRRNGGNAADTALGSVLMTDFQVFNT